MALHQTGEDLEIRLEVATIDVCFRAAESTAEVHQGVTFVAVVICDPDSGRKNPRVQHLPQFPLGKGTMGAIRSGDIPCAMSFSRIGQRIPASPL